MKQTKSASSAPQTIEILQHTLDSAQQMYFDGVSSIDFGAANCKLHFYQIVGRDQDTNVEQRKIVLTAVMPTAALAELCLSTLKNIDGNIPRLKDALVEHERKIFAGGSFLEAKKEISAQK